MDFELTYPLWLLILPLPLLVYWLAPRYTTQRSAIKVPFFHDLRKLLGVKLDDGVTVAKPQFWQRSILIFGWVLVVMALTKPMMLAPPQTHKEVGRDVMVMVDLSGSMNTNDFKDEQGNQITRLQAAKNVLKDFSDKRKGDRLGLILFGDAAFVQSPFTADHDVWLSLLNEAQIPMAGQSTHMGDALGLAIKVLQENDTAPQASNQDQNQAENNTKKDKLAIMLTDGNDTNSFVAPIDAAKVANAKGVKIHMIAMGDPKTVGESAMDMDAINQVASLSGGTAFQALDNEQLAQAYDTINELEPQLYNSITYRPRISLHPYFMMALLLCGLLAYSVASFQRMSRRRNKEGV